MLGRGIVCLKLVKKPDKDTSPAEEVGRHADCLVGCEAADCLALRLLNALKEALEAPWEMRKSRSELGWWYFYNPDTGVRTWEPWFPKKSETANEYNYINVFTHEFSRDPPTDLWAKAAASAGKAKPMLRLPEQVRSVKLMIPVPFPYSPAATDARVYFYNQLTKETFWSPWFRASSTQKPGQFYYFNVLSGQSTWAEPKDDAITCFECVQPSQHHCADGKKGLHEAAKFVIDGSGARSNTEDDAMRHAIAEIFLDYFTPNAG